MSKLTAEQSIDWQKSAKELLEDTKNWYWNNLDQATADVSYNCALYTWQLILSGMEEVIPKKHTPSWAVNKPIQETIIEVDSPKYTKALEVIELCKTKLK